HEGHASLMSAASECDVVAASIFVNPLQFAPEEDLATYPRDLDRDLGVCAHNGVDHVLHPTVEEMYPHGAVLTTVSVGTITDRFEGEADPSTSTVSPPSSPSCSRSPAHVASTSVRRTTSSWPWCAGWSRICRCRWRWSGVRPCGN